MTPTSGAAPWYRRLACAVSSTRPVRVLLGPELVGREARVFVLERR